MEGYKWKFKLRIDIMLLYEYLRKCCRRNYFIKDYKVYISVRSVETVRRRTEFFDKAGQIKLSWGQIWTDKVKLRIICEVL